MARQEGTETIQSKVKDLPPERAGNATYNLLMRQSRKLGRTATRTLVGAKNLLQNDMAIPGTDKMFQGFSRKKRIKSEVDELKKVVKQSHEVIAEVQTVFPVTLFPDKLCLDRSVITITKRNFFWSSSNTSIRIEDVFNVSTTLGPIFGSLTIASRIMNSIDHYTINFLWRQDAQELKYMIQGYMIATHSNIDVKQLSTKELVETLRELGRGGSSNDK